MVVGVGSLAWVHVSCRHTEIRANFARFVHQQMRKPAALVKVRFIHLLAVKNAIYVSNEKMGVWTFADSRHLDHRVYPWFVQMMCLPRPASVLP